jgi:hypothetical protein
LPFDEALAYVEITSLKKQRDELQAKIDEVLSIPHRPIHEADTESERASRRGFNLFRSLAHTTLSSAEPMEAQNG